MSLATAMAAVKAWVAAATGITASKVIWSQQEGFDPGGDHVSLRVTNIRAIGVDAVARRAAPDPVVELKEIERHVAGTREVTLSVQCFGTNKPGAAIGEDAPVARLSRLVAAAHMPTSRRAFQAAGVGFLSAGGVQSLDGLLGASYQPRAVVDIRLSFVDELSEFGTYVESIELTNQLTGRVTQVAIEETP